MLKKTEKGLLFQIDKIQKTKKELYLPLSIRFDGMPEKIIAHYLYREGKFLRRDAKYINKNLKLIALLFDIKVSLSLHWDNAC